MFTQGNIKGQVAWFYLFKTDTQAKGLFTEKKEHMREAGHAEENQR